MFVLVRHAHAVSKRTWKRDDGQRPLSERGFQQASALVDALSAVRTQRLLSSPLLRCRQTLEPLARRSRIPIEETPLLAPDADAVLLSLLTQDSRTADAVLCTHGETFVALFKHWQSHGRLRLGLPIEKIDKRIAQKSGAWIMEDDGVHLRGHYLPAPDLMLQA